MINIGSNFEVSILELANIIRNVVGFSGDMVFDSQKPDGTPRKKLDTSFLDSQGWKASTNLESGIKKTIQWYLENRA